MLISLDTCQELISQIEAENSPYVYLVVNLPLTEQAEWDIDGPKTDLCDERVNASSHKLLFAFERIRIVTAEYGKNILTELHCPMYPINNKILSLLEVAICYSQQTNIQLTPGGEKSSLLP